MARENRDVVGFRRIFVLFCTLVLLPAMLMSGFAVVAIRNEATAERLRLRERAEQALFAAETRLLELLEETDQGARARTSSALVLRGLMQLRDAGLPIGPALLIAADGTVVDADELLRRDAAGEAPLVQRVVDVGRALSVGESAHIEVEQPRDGVMSVQHLPDGRLLAYFLDDERLATALSAPPADGAMTRVQLVVTRTRKADAEVGAVDRLLGDLVRSADRAQRGWLGEGSGDAPVRRLAAPFGRYSLEASGGIVDRGARNTAIYVSLLVVFYAILITGVVIISRLVWREARLSALKTDFVSHVSHELRTPLTSIRMFIETLKMHRATPEEEEECIELLARETERLSEMIERVLGYARLKSGRRQFSLDAIDVDDAIEDAIAAFKTHLLAEKHTTLAIDRNDTRGLPRVCADHEALVEALLNLLGNAYKYTSDDKRIRIFARIGKRRMAIGVEDNGPGLPKSEHKRVFERFYQARNLLSRTSQGSGLGLAITKAIIEGQGGRVRVESEPGRGATFLIELRFAPQAAPTGGTKLTR
ncbi:MAG: sensor histidine kinase [Myxococcota bacterium]